jgi:prophage antirepressor-like protein
MEELQKVFNYEGAEVRTVTKGEEVWFVAKDVCDVLEIGNVSQALTRLDEDEKNTIILNEGIGNPNKMIINEAGLYTLILSSRKPEAKAFKRWITHEVLPTIRKTGGYVSNADMMVNTYFGTLPVEQKMLIKSLFTNIEEQQKQIQQRDKYIEETKPLITFAERCIASNESILVRELAKVACDEGIKIGERNLYKKLREWNLIMKGKTEPTQYAMNRDLFEVIERVVNTPYGSKLSFTTKVKPKGQIYIIERLMKEQEELVG